MRVEQRRAPSLVIRGRVRALDVPARFGGAGLRLRIEAQGERRDALARRGRRQALARRQIERLCITRDFENDGAERGTRERIIDGAQNAGGVWRMQKQKARWIEAELGKPRRRDLAEFTGGDILADPEHRLAARGAESERDRKARGGRLMGSRGEDLVQRADEEATLEEIVRIRMAERSPCRLFRRQPGFRQRRPQRRKLLCGFAHRSKFFSVGRGRNVPLASRERPRKAARQRRDRLEHKENKRNARGRPPNVSRLKILRFQFKIPDLHAVP